ncbi:efflux RND transporter permease subunit [Anaeromyxobacter oryzae]|uniref:Cation transporter n=1 Tax=Anaeromyxobacter oryzae TaxID=2918170 RepID=A0ABM7WYS1_9BACT|nr:CusA/CzcA family heavy metal efflux RND transporter [Anaeromyxobacter oryzae]BDG04683.1 cation transporter [Anaeromyxobacter oryzae]
MLNRLVDWSLRERWAVLVLTAAFVAAGLWAFHELPIEAFPDVTDTQVQVITLFPGHAPEEVERQVTSPIEKELNGTPQLSAMRSISIYGLSVVTLTFEDGTDNFFARSQVSERLRQVDVPDGVTPSLGPLYTPIGEIYRYVLVPDPQAEQSPMALRELQDWVLERQLRHVAGVADVVSFGGYQKQFQVEVDPARLKGQGVSLRQVFEALQRSNANAGGNYLRHGAEEMVIRGIGYLGSADDLRNVVVAARSGTPLTVGDVARVSVGAVPRRGQVSKDRTDEVVEGIVLLRKGENPGKVLEGIHAKVEALNGGVLPKGVRIVPYYDRTTLVDHTLHTVLHNLAEGAVLVTAVVLLFLLSWRGAVVVAAVIPISLLGSFLYLKVRGMSANLLSLGAVDFGIIVDGAVVIVENVFRRRHAEPAAPAAGVVRRAVHEVARPTLFSLGIIIVAYVPIFTLQRVEGRIFAPMANTVASALVGALIASLTLVPVLSALLLGKEKERQSPVVRVAERAYGPALRFALAHRGKVLLAAAVALAGALVLAGALGSEFLPELDEGSLWVTATLPPSVSLEEAERMAPRIRAALLEFPEVRTVVAQLGRPEDGTDPAPVNSLQMFVDLAPEDRWTTARSKEDLVAQMDARLRKLPGIDYNFSQPIKDNVEEGISGIKGQVAVKLFGEDLGKLDALASKVERALAGVPGVADLAVIQAGQLPQVQIAIDRQKIARYGIAVADVDEAIETALGGKVATQLWEGERKFDVDVRFPSAFRGQLSAIRDVLVPAPDGPSIPLSELAAVRVGEGRAAINRESNQRFIGIKMNVRGRDLGGFVRDAQAAVGGAVELPAGYQITWGGEFENQQRAMHRLAIVIPLSILLILVLLLKAFGRLRSALLILANIPFALIGGVVALYVSHTNLSVSAAVGFIALIGQAVLNGVLLLSDIEARRRAGAGVVEAVEAGAQARLRAVLMTALLAALGLLPAALSHAIGAETQRPLAIVVIGGLVSATLLTLFVLPVLYALVEGRRSGGLTAGDGRLSVVALQGAPVDRD